MKPLKFEWLDLVMSESGPRSTCRLVLFVLAHHMNNDGSSCYPGVRLIQQETGFASRQAVIKALQDAVDEGWIEKVPRSGGRRGGTYHEYRPLIPDWVSGLPSEPLPTTESGLPAEPLTETDDSETGLRRFGKRSTTIPEAVYDVD